MAELVYIPRWSGSKVYSYPSHAACLSLGNPVLEMSTLRCGGSNKLPRSCRPCGPGQRSYSILALHLEASSQPSQPLFLMLRAARPLKSLLAPSAPQLDRGGKETLALLRSKASLLEGAEPSCSSQPLTSHLYNSYAPILPILAAPSIMSSPSRLTHLSK